MRLGLLAAAWVAGIFIGLRVDVAVLPLLLLLLATLTTGIILHLYRPLLWPALLAGVLLVALLRVEATDEPLMPLAAEDGETVTLRGRVMDDPETTAQRIKLLLDVEAIDRGDGLVPLQAKALAYAKPPDSLVSFREPPYFRYGDMLLVTGQVQPPRSLAELDYASYLANQGISGVIFPRDVVLVSLVEGSGGGWRGRIFDLRRELAQRINDALPEPQSAVARALLLGQRGPLPADLKQEFRDTGTAHLLAISGLHVGVLMVLALAVSGGVLGRRWGVYLVIPLVLIWLYALISGLPLSVVRAALMGSVFLAAMALGRPRSILPALAASAAAMVAASPQVLQQVSFQLSFGAMAGIALVLPLLPWAPAAIVQWSQTSHGRWTPWIGFILRWLVTALIVSVAATLATWPLVALNFDRIPLLGIPATILTLPVLPLILMGTLATAVTGLIHPDLGQFFGWISWVPLSYLIELVSRLPGYTISGAWVGSGLVWAWYLVLGTLVLLAAGIPYLTPRWHRLRGLLVHPSDNMTVPALPLSSAVRLTGLSIGLVVASVFLWMQVFSGSDGKLHVYFFDVGQGDSALIVTPHGKQVLVDGGPEAESAVRALSGPMSAGDRSLDMLVLTHLDADHSRGLLEVLDRYRVASVVVGLENPDSSLYAEWQAVLERAAPMKIPVKAGHRIILEPDLSLEVLNPPARPIGGSIADQNNNGVVLRIVYDRVSFLLAADIEAMAENYLVRRSRSVASTVLKVAHHGSKTSTTTRFLSRVDPVVVVVSVGKTNRYGHPHPEIVQRLGETLGLDGVYRTDRDGTIEFISDGEQLWVKTAK